MNFCPFGSEERIGTEPNGQKSFCFFFFRKRRVLPFYRPRSGEKRQGVAPS